MVPTRTPDLLGGTSGGRQGLLEYGKCGGRSGATTGCSPDCRAKRSDSESLVKGCFWQS